MSQRFRKSGVPDPILPGPASRRYPVAPDEVVETHQEKACILPSAGPVDNSGPVLHLVANGKPTLCPLA